MSDDRELRNAGTTHDDVTEHDARAGQRDQGPMVGHVAAAGPNPMALASLIEAAPQQAHLIMATIATMYGNTVVQNTFTARDQLASGGGRVTASTLNIRSEPIKGDNVVGQLTRGEMVQPVATHGPWLQVPHDGKQGFVWASWVEIGGAPIAAHDSANAHEETQHIAAPVAPAVVPEPAAPAPNHQEPVEAIKPPAVAAPTPAVAAPTPAVAMPPAPVEVAAPTPAVTITPAPPAHEAAPPTIAATATPHAIQDPKAATFETIEQTRVQVNHDDEGAVETKIRAFKHQFNPVWLKALQQKLSVGDATGAFNTETLRALRDVTKKKLTADQITDQSFLKSLGTQYGVEGDPYFEGTIVETEHHDEKDPTATDPADIAAQAVGYASYDEYYGGEMKAAKFLDVSLRQGASDGTLHPHMKARLEAAESYLVARFGSKEKAIQGTGWSKKIGGSYATKNAAHDPKDPKSHMHTMGLAIDIDANANPYTMAVGDGAAADWIYWFYETGWEMGSKLGFGGDVLNLKSIYAEGTKMSSEELHEHMLASSKSFAKTVELSEQSDDEIKIALVRAGYKDDASDKGAQHLIDKWFHTAKKIFHNSAGGRLFHETMTESKELLVALRDVAGLNWGGTEMSSGQNGDFMHFDNRNDDFGHKVYQAGYDAQQARKKHK